MKREYLLPRVSKKIAFTDDPMNVLNQAPNVGFERGMLSVDLLDKMIQEAIPKDTPDAEKPAVSIGRTIAPIKEREPVQIQYRNNLPDWKERDFSGIATDVDNDILVHYDITGNSTTEGKWDTYKHVSMTLGEYPENDRQEFKATKKTAGNWTTQC